MSLTDFFVIVGIVTTVVGGPILAWFVVESIFDEWLTKSLVARGYGDLLNRIRKLEKE